MQTMTRDGEFSAATPSLLLAFELGERTWKLGFTVGMGQRPRVRQIPAGAVGLLAAEIAHAKRRFGLPAEVPVISCYEAGRDGFWLHRYLVAHAIINHIVDSSSIEVNRRARRAKTDRLDLGGLLSLLARYVQGDRRVWRVVRVPTLAEEDARQLPRTAESLTRDRTRLVNRLKALLVTQGVRLRIDRHFVEALDGARLWDDTPIPAGLRDRVLHDWEIFGWRQIRNGRQLGALVGLVPAPYQSGETRYDQGITRAGNTHVRRVMVQLAWGWLRFQPTSALALWYQRRFGHGGMRLRKIGIVALARKLLVALWRYLETGAVPDGATLKPVMA